MQRLEDDDKPAEGFRLSPQQRRLWAERLRQTGDWQNTVIAVLVEGDVDTAGLDAAVAELVARHEILRTRFYTPPGAVQPLQVIGEPDSRWWKVEVVTAGEPATDEGARIEALLAGSESPGVDPVEGPTVKVTLAALGDRRSLLAVTMPTLVSDGRGAVSLVRELVQAWSETAGAGPGEREVLQYADLAEWQNELLESEEMQAGRAYWEEMGWRSLPAAALPFEGRHGAGAFTPGRVSLTVAAETVRRLDAEATSRGASLRALLLTCWQVLLARLGGGSETAMAVGYDGRRHEGLAEALGVFVRYLPFPARIDSTMSLHKVLQAVVRLDSELRRWQECFPVEEAADGRFSTVRFGFRELAPGSLLVAGSQAVRLHGLTSYGDRFHLALEAARSGESLTLELHYDTGLFPRRAIDLVAARLGYLLDEVAADPGRQVGTLGILPPAERDTVLRSFNPQTGGVHAPDGLLERFEQWAAREPQRLAVVAGAERSSYGELNARANRLAHHLRDLGAGPETRVAICLERSLAMVVALLGTLKAGAAFVPIDPATPSGRAALMLHDGGADLMVSTEALRSALPATGLGFLALDGESAAIAGRPEGNLPSHPAPGHLAYVIFTSGSTGRPKAVGVEHRQLSQYVAAVLERLSPPAGASFATVSTFSADLGYTAVFPALVTGGCLHVLAADQAIDPQDVVAYCRSQTVDVLKITPSHLSALLSSLPTADLLPRERLVLGGEALRWDLVKRVTSLAPECVIFNHYGPTEATVGVSAFEVGPGAAEEVSGTVPIGRPLGHARIYLLDPAGWPVPLGAGGELYLGGAGISRGYLGDRRLTAERFVPDPYAGEPGARLYRSGDRGRWLLSGDVEFLGRVDDQLKIRGFRVEPGEIDKVLERHPAVAAAKVVGRETGPGETRLAAYVAVDGKSAGPVQRLVRLRDAGLLREQQLLELPNGLMVAHLNEGETRFLYREIFEERTYLKHGIHIPEGGCVLDVGASIGLFSLLAGRMARGVRVLAFEPVPKVHQALRLNAEIHGGIRVCGFGLSRESRQAAITFYPHLTLMSSLYADAEEERAVVRSFLRRREREGGGELPADVALEELLEDRLAAESVTVELRRLSEVLHEEGIERVDLLKIDVQKSEHDVLAGIDDGDWPKIHQIVLEVHDVDGRLAEIRRLLEARGFEVTTEQEGMLTETPLYDLYARRPELADQPPSANGPEEDDTPAWSGPGALSEDLRRHLQAAFPEHMVPSTLSLLAELPLTSNGKVDRRALPEPEAVSFEARRGFEAPTTATEKKLVEIWSAVLESGRFGIRDSFFDIGGHSLLATRVVSRVRKTFEVEVTLRDLFNHPTIAGLAQRVEAAEPIAASSDERIERLVRAAYRQGGPPAV